MESPSFKVQCQAALALRNLASDELYQLEIARHPVGLQRLLVLLHGTPVTPLPAGAAASATSPAPTSAISSAHPQLILAAVACIRNISIHPQNEDQIIDAGFLRPLTDLLEHDNEEVQCHAISTLRNLAAGNNSGADGSSSGTAPSATSGKDKDNKERIVESGALDKIRTLIERSTLSSSSSGKAVLSWSVLSEMTACLAVLALSDKLKPRLLSSGMVHTLIPLTLPQVPADVQGNAAAAIGNLATKVDDREMQPFVEEWTGICAYLERFLEPVPGNSSSSAYHEQDEAVATFQHIAIWTVLQFCEKGRRRMRGGGARSHCSLLF